MKLEEIMKLIDAGYTKDEIAEFKALESGTEPAGTEPAGTEPAGTEPAGTEPAGTEPAGTDPDQNAAILKVLQELQKSNTDLTKAIQSMNRKAAEHGINPALDADQILKEIIEGGTSK